MVLKYIAPSGRRFVGVGVAGGMADVQPIASVLALHQGRGRGRTERRWMDIERGVLIWSGTRQGAEHMRACVATWRITPGEFHMLEAFSFLVLASSSLRCIDDPPQVMLYILRKVE